MKYPHKLIKSNYKTVISLTHNLHSVYGGGFNIGAY